MYLCFKKLVTNNTAALIFQYFLCLHLIYCEVAWVLVPLGTQVQTQMILKADYLPDYLSFSDDVFINITFHQFLILLLLLSVCSL